MTTISFPEVSFVLEGQQPEASNAPQQVLLMGQKNNTGISDGSLQINIGNNQKVWEALFGLNSHVSEMIRNFKKINKETRLDVIAFEAFAGSVASAGSIQFSGTATEDGTYLVTIGSKLDASFLLTVQSGDTGAEISADLVTSMNFNSLTNVNGSRLATGTLNIDTVDMASINTGSFTNDISLKVEGVLAGLTVTVSAMTGGGETSVPPPGTIFDAIAGQRYQTYAYPSTWNLDTIRLFLDGNFNAPDQILDGVAIVSRAETLSGFQGAPYNTYNSQSLLIPGYKPIGAGDTQYKGNSILETLDHISSQVAAIRSLRLTDGAIIGDLLSGARGLDNFGGPALSSRPYANTLMRFLPLFDVARGWTQPEIKQLLTAGISTSGNNVAGNGHLLGQMVTTYKNDNAGNPDISFKFLNFVDTASNVREFFFRSAKIEFAQMRLTDGDLTADRPGANEGSIRAWANGVYDELSGPDFVLTRAGEDQFQLFSENMNITIDLDEGEATLIMNVVPLVSQFRKLNGVIKIAFSTD